MGIGEFVRLKSAPETLLALSSGLTRFGPTAGSPEWLVSGVWLCAGAAQYLATASVVVLPDGFVERGLTIGTAQELTQGIEAELPDTLARLHARGNDMELPDVPDAGVAPAQLEPWPAGPYSTLILVRLSTRCSVLNRVACALLFENEDKRLLVGTDPSTLAMVLSQDSELIDRYQGLCEAMKPDEYLGC